MGVEQLHKQVLFDGISSKLRMYKTSAIGMLFEVFLCQIQQFKRMTIISNAIEHYQFSSCLRTYLLTCRLIQYPKTVEKASPHVSASFRPAISSKRLAINLIAACARIQDARGRFDSEKLAFKCLEGFKTHSNRLRNTKAGGLTHTGGNHRA
jgi:hypothetical protein